MTDALDAGKATDSAGKMGRRGCVRSTGARALREGLSPAGAPDARHARRRGFVPGDVRGGVAEVRNVRGALVVWHVVASNRVSPVSRLAARAKKQSDAGFRPWRGRPALALAA